MSAVAETSGARLDSQADFDYDLCDPDKIDYDEVLHAYHMNRVNHSRKGTAHEPQTGQTPPLEPQ